MDPRLLEFERMIVDAWPAGETADVDGWLLRASGGPTHRGNSVATLAATGSASLDDRIARVERWYRERGQPAMFQIGPCASPAGLDGALAERGYAMEGTACFALAPAADVFSRTGSPHSGMSARVDSRPTRAWVDINASASRFASRLDSFLGFVVRLGSRCRFVTIHALPDVSSGREPAGGDDDAGAAVASALGITGAGQRLGVYAMLTAPAFRRRGAARAALHALAEHAMGLGLPELYLLFDSENVAARSLYEGSGFASVYGYHYRSKRMESGGGAAPVERSAPGGASNA